MTEREPLLTAKEVKAEIDSRSNLYDEPTRAAFFLGATWGAQVVRSKMEARAQPAQDGHVPEASCGECGKKASDGWALYCVACMEEAGLPGGTNSPLLTHSCTSSLVRTPDSTEQAGQVLTDEDMRDALRTCPHDTVENLRVRWLYAKDFARAIEQAVLAKRVPMERGWMCLTDFQHELGAAAGGVTIYPSLEDLKANRSCWEHCGVIEVGIVGEKGGA